MSRLAFNLVAFTALGTASAVWYALRPAGRESFIDRYPLGGVVITGACVAVSTLATAAVFG